MKSFQFLIAALGFSLLVSLDPVFALANSDDSEDKVDVDKIKEKYWARGNESELGVVQNRLYSKSKKIQLSLIGGVAFSDPFLSVGQIGGSIGYHFNEYFSLHLIGWKSFAGNSSALTAFTSSIEGIPAINRPDWYLGGEFAASLLYGKLSVVGKAIIYYDMHLLAGGGATTTENGIYGTASAGLGQQFFFNQWLSLSVDYRLMWYREQLVERTITSRLGQPIGERDNWNHTINLGVNFLWGF